MLRSLTRAYGLVPRSSATWAQSAQNAGMRVAAPKQESASSRRELQSQSPNFASARRQRCGLPRLGEFELRISFSGRTSRHAPHFRKKHRLGRRAPRGFVFFTKVRGTSEGDAIATHTTERTLEAKCVAPRGQLSSQRWRRCRKSSPGSARSPHLPEDSSEAFLSRREERAIDREGETSHDA